MHAARSSPSRPLCRAPIAIACLIAACARDESRHVYRSAPPPPAPALAAAASPAVELPLGAGGPTARIVAVRLSSTGAPTALDRVTEPLDVVTLVARGRGSSSAGPAHLQLRLSGRHDTTLVERLDTPVPAIVAHTFHLSAPDGSPGLPDGAYQMQVRLIGPNGRVVAASIPVFLGVAPH